MAQKTKSEFLALFVSGYTVTAQDMNDLCDSALFYSDDIGYDGSGRVYVVANSMLPDIDLSSLSLIKLPNLDNAGIVTLSIAHNSFPSIPNTPFWPLMTALNCSSCDMTSFNSSQNFPSITNFDFSNNDLDNVSVENILKHASDSGNAVTVNLSGGSNASHATWTANALGFETTILSNGGSVSSNP